MTRLSYSPMALGTWSRGSVSVPGEDERATEPGPDLGEHSCSPGACHREHSGEPGCVCPRRPWPVGTETHTKEHFHSLQAVLGEHLCTGREAREGPQGPEGSEAPGGDAPPQLRSLALRAGPPPTPSQGDKGGLCAQPHWFRCQ